MDFKQSVLHCLRDNYAQFEGRAGRPEFWWFMLACLLASTLPAALNLTWLGLLLNLALCVPCMAAGSRRLHDIGKSGWLQLLWLIPVAGWAVLVFWLAQPSDGANDFGAVAAK
ncbi:DUF805 domain-containing protein [Ramlibacter humi]|uniref:DUF805 domain-containing protein n=1 Tax=Ramlibacter humi TaxID=2530451 RepID=A0A4Z0BPV2_9BURK|nr:DUF805 domain-containing protein [Ramlibacter humi]TFZ00268.1 DUF805 domain-containing protein [Ramlibacter humi]